MTTSAPSLLTSSVSKSPTKEALRPNPHPYAIKTTSTGLLSRSNSTSSSSKPSHHYIPSPSPSPSRIHHRQGSTHRYSKSLTEQPRPLPAPPSPSPTKQLFGFGYGQGSHGHSPSIDVDLPANPKLWTPSQLASYLATALRVRSGDALQLPAPVARDIAAFVRDARITGKVFLRITDNELEDFGVNKLWASALLGASRTLRQNILKGRIWGFGSAPDNDTKLDNRELTHSPEHDFSFHDDDDDDNLHGIHYSSASSTSSLDQPMSDGEFFGVADLDGTPGKRSTRIHASGSSKQTPPHRISARALARSKSGHVKGMIKNLERGASVDDSEGSGFRARSGSESSAASEGDGSWHGVHNRAFGNGTARMRGTHSAFANHRDAERQYDTTTEGETRYDTATEGSVRYDTATEDGNDASPERPGHHEEPSIEDLLAQQGHSGDAYSGVSAWEQDGVVTVRRAPGVDPNSGRPLPTPPALLTPPVMPTPPPLSPSHTPGRPLPIPLVAPRPTSASATGSLRRLGAVWSAEAEAEGLLPSLDNVDGTQDGGKNSSVKRRTTRVKAMSGKSSRGSPRRVSANEIFANGVEEQTEAGTLVGDAKEHQEPDKEAEKALAAAEAEIAGSRAMLEAFRARLEEVERNIAVMEEREAQREHLVTAAAQDSSAGPSKRENDAQTEHPSALPRSSLGTLDAWIRSHLRRYLPPWLVLHLGNLPPFSFVAPVHSVPPRQYEMAQPGASSASSPRASPRAPPSQSFIDWLCSLSPLRWEPRRLRALPSYLLLVGLGVAAAVLRLVVRRVGHGARYGVRGAGAWRK
ncbi:hypothetical protein HGRIS_000792 [Hohenbuehelia grisea]|uniref:SAM domain-containing protein n=1 Tax=Hohenbuehelia grisea TaxID=104357 RepID=A0ABR3IPW0_9AGAR